jgi:hypothetical protein
MGRIIKFRGKRVDNGQWVFGYYLSDTETTLMLYVIYSERKFHKVIPKTLGQFTGLTDKTGKEVYESDKIEEGVVFWSDEYLGFFVKGEFAEGENRPLYDIPFVEVIGNIHENPDLISNNEKIISSQHCSCKDSTGWTEIKCCNICGKPTEKFWIKK